MVYGRLMVYSIVLFKSADKWKFIELHIETFCIIVINCNVDCAVLGIVNDPWCLSARSHSRDHVGTAKCTRCNTRRDTRQDAASRSADTWYSAWWLCSRATGSGKNHCRCIPPIVSLCAIKPFALGMFVYPPMFLICKFDAPLFAKRYLRPEWLVYFSFLVLPSWTMVVPCYSWWLSPSLATNSLVIHNLQKHYFTLLLSFQLIDKSVSTDVIKLDKKILLWSNFGSKQYLSNNCCLWMSVIVLHWYRYFIWQRSFIPRAARVDNGLTIF